MKKLLLLLPALALAVFDSQTYVPNNWRCAFSNYGTWGSVAQAAGGFWHDTAYVYGAGIWIGRMNGNDTLVTNGYNPNSGRSEMFPTLTRDWRAGSSNPQDRIYSYPSDWPAPPDRFPMAPTTPRADVDIWACCCDSSLAQHQSPGRPIGFDLYMTAYAFADSPYDDLFFLKYELANRSGATMGNTYVGLAMDADVGDATNDGTGLIRNRLLQVGGDTIRVRNTGYCYSYDNVPSGAVAVMLLGEPSGLGLTAFKLFTVDIDPLTDGTQYQTLAGYDYRTGQYVPYDSIDQTVADKRFLLATGPFDLEPDSIATFVYAVIGTPYAPNDTSELARRCRWADEAWQRILGVSETGSELAVQTAIVGPTVLSRATGLKLTLPPGERAVVSVRDATGREVVKPTPFSATGRLDFGSRPAGVYLVQVGPPGRARTLKVLYLGD